MAVTREEIIKNVAAFQKSAEEVMGMVRYIEIEKISFAGICKNCIEKHKNKVEEEHREEYINSITMVCYCLREVLLEEDTERLLPQARMLKVFYDVIDIIIKDEDKLSTKLAYHDTLIDILREYMILPEKAYAIRDAIIYMGSN